MNERICLIFGKTGTGKTTLAKKLIADEKRIVAIDPLNEFNDFVFLYNFDEAYEFFKRIDSGSSFKVSIRFNDDIDFEYLFKLLFEIKNLILVLEEAEMYISPAVKSSSFLRLVRYGRHSKIKILGIARRTAELSRDFRSQVNRIISFKQTDEMDLKNMSLLGFSNLNNLSEYEFTEIFP